MWVVLYLFLCLRLSFQCGGSESLGFHGLVIRGMPMGLTHSWVTLKALRCPSCHLCHTHSIIVIPPTLALHQRSNCPVLDYQPSKLWVLYVSLTQIFCFSNREKTKCRLGIQLELSSLKKFKNQRLESLSSPQGLHPQLADSLNYEQKKKFSKKKKSKLWSLNHTCIHKF